MRRSIGLMGMAALLGSLSIAPAFGAPTGQSLGLREADDGQNAIQEVQYFWDGYEYCWYDFGWRGPGWYVCDYGPWVTGYWWGGPLGWRGWSVARGRHFGPDHDRRFTGPMEGRPGPNRQFTGPSTQGPSGPNRFQANQGVNRSGPAPGAGMGSFGHSPGGPGGAAVGMGHSGGTVGMGGGGGGGPGGGGGGFRHH